MRTITITGSPTPGKDVVIVAPDEYAFVFAPNTMTVTVGSGYATTEEVTITSNGITLKRNCINRVCKFDLSVIFKSYFKTAKFDIDYALDVYDPFFVDNVAVTVTAGTTTDDVDFTLKWGALQFDEPDAPTVINFPFWVGSPLCLNADMPFVTWKSDELDINGDYSQLIIISSATVDFDFQLLNITPETIQQTNFKVQTCPSDGHYLRWVDGRGKLWHFMFYASKERDTLKEIKTGEVLKQYPESFEDGDYLGRELVISKSKRRSFPCYATVDSDIYPIIESIAASPLVAWYTAERWVNVRIADMTISPKKRFTQDIEFMVLMPEDYVQSR
jgi:hypothetical protein